MSVEKVEATLDEKTAQLQEENISSIYKGEMNAPKVSGTYGMEIKAYDAAGNVSIADSSTSRLLSVDVSKWHTPKTDWNINDRFNIADYNRIKNNLEYLHEFASVLYRPFIIKDMGEDKEETEADYRGSWNYVIFNYFEENLDIINKNIFTKDYGIAQRFFENGAFIQWNELNRIESACLDMYDILQRQKAGIRKLPFKLGNMKGVKI